MRLVDLVTFGPASIGNLSATELVAGGLSTMEPETAFPRQSPRFRHEALVYKGTEDFVARTATFVREGLDAREAVLVAVIKANARALRGELGRDAREVEFLDMESLGRNPARI